MPLWLPLMVKIILKLQYSKLLKGNMAMAIGSNVSDNNIKQDGPSLESSSYLNVTLRYLRPLDPGTMGPLDFWTF